ncbi:MAG: nucleotidyltransferase [Acidaminococcaceae bacterium]
MTNKKCIGIVAEYNPFHSGHAYHLAAARETVGDLPVIAVMSGNFVQRGIPALTDKWSRAAIATRNGVDLVLELPAIFSCRSAEHFARGAIKILESTGCVTHLSFGCETPDISLLEQAAQVASNSQRDTRIELSKGLSYAAAMGSALSKTNPELAKTAEQPNNILAIEYLKQINILQKKIIPVPISRVSAMYNDKEIRSNIASATAIRHAFRKNGLTEEIAKVVSPLTFSMLLQLNSENRLGHKEEYLDLLLSFLMRQLSPDSIARCCECSEGLEYKIAKAANAFGWSETISMIKSKRYPETRINRLLLQILLSSKEITFKDAISTNPSYLRVLAFNNRGRLLLKKMKNTATLPIITKLGKNAFTYNDKNNNNLIASLKIDLAASNLFSLLQGNSLSYPADFKNSPFYLSE